MNSNCFLDNKVHISELVWKVSQRAVEKIDVFGTKTMPKYHRRGKGVFLPGLSFLVKGKQLE